MCRKVEGSYICIICIELDKNKLNFMEAYRAMLEIYTSGEIAADHVEEIIEKLDKKERETKDD